MPDVRYCPSCGSQVSVSERFCGNCGARMDQPASVAPTLPLAGQAAPPTQVLPSTQPPGQPSAFNVPPGSTALPPRRGLPIWVIILLAIGALAVVGCIATVGALTLLGQRVSSVFATTEAGLTTTSRPSGQGGG
ncbi:MAG: zinc-ribbon domain-containing protein, partial [Oscillochloris sp.]|nr:zinc-ribbon domain-containing protein [Oscillochloris sp.]